MTIGWMAPRSRGREEEVDQAARAPRELVLPADGDGDGRAARATLRRVAPRLAPPTGEDAGVDQWVPLGPHVTLGGQATRHPRISGRCRAIAVSPDGRRVYAGTALGGTWFSRNRGEHWTPLDFYATTRDLDGELGEANALAVGAIAVRFGGPDDGSQDEVYVGTGEMRFLKYAPLPLHVQGVGIRRAVGPGQAVATGGVTADPWTLEATELAGAAVLRLVVDDATGEVWVATTRGLLRRPGGAGPGASWEEVETGLDPATLCDVVLTRGEGGGPRRVWVASSRPALAFRPLGASGAFTPVHLPVFPLPETAKVVPVTMVALAEGNIAGQAIVYLLADGPRLWRVHDAKAEVVEGLPDDLFGEQATYDMAIAVHPVAPDWIAVAGMGIDTGPGLEQYDAALFSERVVPQTGRPGWRFTGGGAKPGTGQQPSFVGTGVHADVHDLAWVPGPAGGASELWVACDGGVFRSRDGGARGTFAARNTGLGTIEAQYLAQHPTNDTVLLVGTQDNGVVRALGPETWHVASPGDGGGVAIDPLDPRRQFAQYLHSRWVRSLDGGASFEDVTLLGEAPTVLDLAAWEAAAKEEHDAASPYAGAAAIASGSVTQLAVGTNRVWLSTDWGANWATIPSGKDPYDQFEVTTAPDRTLDVLPDGGRIFALKWASPDALHVLTEEGVFLFSRSSVPGSPWTRVRRYDRPAVRRATKAKTPSGQIPAHLALTDLASHDLHRAGLGSLYVGTSGIGDEHLWWFDGAGRWLPARLPVDSPVHAVVVDPAHPEVVYAGTDVGVWKGVGTFPAPGVGDPAWTWTQLANALPEAGCIDLVIHAQARLLRACLRGRGVWELALDGVAQERVAYLRAHAFDSRRTPLPASGPGARDPLGDPADARPLRLDASPDLRAYRAVGAPPPPFGTGDWTPYEIWVLQAAMKAGGVVVEATGVFDDATSDHGKVKLPKTAAEWEARVGGALANTLPFDHDPPDAADVTVTLRDEPDHRPTPVCSCSAGGAGARVWAVVHGREARPLAPARVAVFVLRTPFTGPTDLSGVPALPGGWAGKLRTDLAAKPPGPWPASSGWAYLDATTPFRRPARPVDPREAQVVQFDVPAAAWPAGDWLLLAVVVAEDDPLGIPEEETAVAALVRRSRHVAARSVRRGAP